MQDQDANEGVAAALAGLVRAFESAVSAIQNDPDADRAYAEATELVETLQRFSEASGDLRAQSAARIFKSERLSLSGLADRISISKARAAQLINTAKKADEKANPVPEEAT
ncbi:hypothetical protein DP939_21080 [Spongiactinospora rosea]|uniref:Uncharacterized protein n=1 Tax=Spongiactinospora rosea TaxID=2248750 RepID=A0A366LWR0_9ACTN|nr:hypothetical protein [Spongiactinospora rosea]RBQ18361.1 hypothetical protein DP939_21080 [Spongiactinospora rosea]